MYKYTFLRLHFFVDLKRFIKIICKLFSFNWMSLNFLTKSNKNIFDFHRQKNGCLIPKYAIDGQS